MVRPQPLASVDLHLEPNEASDLTEVDAPGLLAAHGWDRAFLTVLDEGAVEDCVAVLGHAAGADALDGWESHRIRLDAGREEGRTDDAEAVAVRDGIVYVVGSHYGSKDGPLQAKRHWLARFAASELDEGVHECRPALEVARTRFRLHRAVNDALKRAGVELFELSERARETLVGATRARGEEKGKGWASYVHDDDLPINVEGATFGPAGTLVLGLRFPVTAGGHPILVEVPHVDALFADPRAVPETGDVWWLPGIGSKAVPAGVRALDHRHLIAGSLDAAGKDSALLDAHPEGDDAGSQHWVTEELPAGGGTVRARLVHDFGDLKRVEGVCDGPGGHVLYVVDEESRVDLRFLVSA